jgi:hypothetical protein
LNISSIRSVTRKPPTTLMVPKITAMSSRTFVKASSTPPSASRMIPPRITMPWIAFVPDMSGVCSVLGTLEITA